MSISLQLASTNLDSQQNLKVKSQNSTTSGVLGILNAAMVLDLNSTNTVSLYIQNTNFAGTIEITGVNNSDETQYFLIPAYPYSPACVGGTAPVPGQPLTSDTLTAAATTRCYTIRTGQLKKVRVRVSAYTSGSCVATFTADNCTSFNEAIVARPPNTQFVTATATVGVAAVANSVLLAPFKPVIQSIEIVRIATAALTASPTPVLVTTINMPGNPTFSFGQDVAGIGVVQTQKIDFGTNGLMCNANSVQINCPTYTGVIWRINLIYRYVA